MPSWQKPQLESLMEEEKAPLVDHRAEYETRKPGLRNIAWAIGPIIFWQLMTGCFAMLSLFLFFQIPAASTSGFEKGFPTDLETAKSALSIEQVGFDGGPSFNENGEEYLRSTHGRRYIGQPSQEIDDNWTDLTKDRWFRLTVEEAQSAWGDEYDEFWDEYAGGYLATIDSMHMLHCLDHIRKAFYPDEYGAPEGVHGITHRDHCIDALRQVIMCNADITPLPTRWYSQAMNGHGIHYVDSDRPHTCRNWAAVREWVTSRSVGSDAVQPWHTPEHKEDWTDF